jgi:rRNA-processing protein FCF1
MPGVDRANLRRALSDVHVSVLNIRGAGVGEYPFDRVVVYLNWVNDAVRMLRKQISSADIDRLVLTRRYELLLAEDISSDSRVLNGLLSAELDERADAFDEAREALEREIKRWSRPGMLVVADTSVYITNPDKLEELDFASLINVREDPVHVLVPIVVVDELDGLKQSKDNHLRWRSRHTLDVIDRVFAHTTGAARLRDENFSALNSGGIPRGEVTIELVFDPPGHTRLPINDDEIIDRALAVQSMAGRSVTLLTYDTGQSTRARATGLKVIKLAHRS